MSGTPPAVSALALRQQAEATFRGKAELSLEELEAMSPEAVRQTLHELGVHQIELQMQNEELQRAQDELAQRVAEQVGAQLRVETQLRTFIQTSPVALAMFDREWRYLEASGRWLADNKLGERDIRGLSHYELFPTLPERWKEIHRRALAGEVIRAEEDHYTRADGSEHWMRWEVRPWHNAEGAVGGILMFSEDITARIQAEAKVRRHRDMLARTESIAQVGSWEWEVATDTVTWSDELFRIFQRNPATGAPSFADHESLYFPEDMAKLKLAVEAATKEGRSYELELRAIPADREARTVLARGYAEIGPGGKVIRLFGFVQDITEQKRAERESVEQQKLIQRVEKSESLGRMAGAIAHYFNNQIQAVMLNLELATSNWSGNAKSAEGQARAMQSARKAAKMSTLMLTYLGQAHVKNTQLDLAEVCQQNLALLRSAMPRGVILETNLPAPGPVISANANQLQEVLTNLMTNAWEACGEGRGAIRLSIKTVSAADIPAAVRFPIDWQPQDSAEAYACLEIADAGGGIEPKDFDKLFDPFFSTKFVGRGLGLPVVLGIARSHDGVVTVESEPSRGSTFRVFIPVSARTLPQKPVLRPTS